AEKRRQRAAQAIIQAVADHQQRQRSGDQDHDQRGAAEQQPGFQTHSFSPDMEKPRRHAPGLGYRSGEPYRKANLAIKMMHNTYRLTDTLSRWPVSSFSVA